MPFKPPKPCAYPGCPKLSNSRFCPDHAKQDAREYERYKRDPETRRRYGKEWRRIRKQYITAHPLCEKCQQDGRVVPAREVHHIIPLAQGGTHAVDNLMALCSSCHSGFTLAEINRARS